MDEQKKRKGAQRNVSMEFASQTVDTISKDVFSIR